MTRFGYGENIRLFIDGGSHDTEISLRMTGFPKGFRPDLMALQAFLLRRAPGRDLYSTKRKESDIPHFCSGLSGGVTDGSEMRAVIRNENAHSEDYKSILDMPRPGHADYPAFMKYGEAVDLRGGGHFSGRLTALLCVAGGLALQYLREKGISVFAHAASIGGVTDTPFDLVSVGAAEEARLQERRFPTLSEEKGAEMQAAIELARKDGDSVGGVIECAATGLPIGLGEHMFGSVEARLSAALYAIPAVKGVEFGAGFAVAEMRGSENNDPYRTDGKRILVTKNNAGGILGGMTSGAPLVFRAAVKPTPSIAKEQESVSFRTRTNQNLTIVGRHDPCIVPRAVPAVEAACGLALLDLILDED